MVESESGSKDRGGKDSSNSNLLRLGQFGLHHQPKGHKDEDCVRYNVGCQVISVL